MTQHITQEQAEKLWMEHAAPLTNSALSLVATTALCNAAIQHYIDSAALAQPASAPAAVSGWKLTDEQLERALAAWFDDNIVGVKHRMRAAVAAAHSITKETSQ